MSKIKIKSYRKNYEVCFIETIDEIVELISNRIAIIDSRVFCLYPQFKKCNNLILVEARECYKTIDFAVTIVNKLIDMQVKKNDIIFAVGGGIIQDLVGFVSSILFRGIGWNFVPTTLLAQADSCIGSKTSINLSGIKNVLGTFYPPNQILSCQSFLNTLEKDEIRSGIGEMYHYFIPNDIEDAIKLSKTDFKKVEKLLPFIKKSLKIKASVIQKDEFDQNERIKFNYGHTFGHGLESITNNSVNHGMAVTIGMDIANYLSYELGFINLEDYVYLKNILNNNLIKVSLNPQGLKKYQNILMKDKKNIQKKTVRCILILNKHHKFESLVYNISKQDLENNLLKYYNSQYSQIKKVF